MIEARQEKIPRPSRLCAYHPGPEGVENAESHFDRFFFFVGNLRPDRSRNEYPFSPVSLPPPPSLSLSLSLFSLSIRVQIRPVTLHNTYFVESFTGGR